MFRNKSVNVHKFAMVPRSDVPRSSFNIQSTHKTTFDAGYLIPIYVDEVLPGDTFNLKMTAFARLSTPLFPVMDNLHLDSFFFFIPYRLVWTNWVKFMGEQVDPGDSIDYEIPQKVSDASGYPIGSIYDYMGLPTLGQVTAAQTVSHNALPLRAYNLVYNEWFRDENLQDSLTVDKTDGPDVTAYALKRRGKRHDYFTSSLPWTQKGDPVTIPLGTYAPVIGDGLPINVHSTAGEAFVLQANTGDAHVAYNAAPTAASSALQGGDLSQVNTGYIADLSTAVSATVNQLRESFQIQKLLERDARGGTRYTEIIRAHFGVMSPDARLQRPEFLGGGSSPVVISPIAQTSGTGASGTTTPVGTLTAMGTSISQGHGFTQSFTEHGIVLGLVSVRADLTYQQGLRRMWSRTTRYDFYFPAFAMLGEQAVLNKEIYVTGTSTDDDVFGYQERWAEYRYNPAMVTSLFRSTAASTIDPWHLAQNFTSLPTLNSTFIEDTPPVERVLAVGAAADGQQFIFDSFFDVRAVRPLPMYSVPGLIDHF